MWIQRRAVSFVDTRCNSIIALSDMVPGHFPPMIWFTPELQPELLQRLQDPGWLNSGLSTEPGQHMSQPKGGDNCSITVQSVENMAVWPYLQTSSKGQGPCTSKQQQSSKAMMPLCTLQTHVLHTSLLALTAIAREYDTFIKTGCIFIPADRL